MFQPVIKWSGSKRHQADNIISYFPRHIETYYEPFCGGASVARALMESKEITVDNFILSDLNEDLINLWWEIVLNPQGVSEHYRTLWTEMNSVSDKSYKRSYFEHIRERYNKHRNPHDFMFIMRTTTNGMPRYNQQGDFNNSFHITRDGIQPDKLEKIIFEWHEILTKNHVEFRHCDYDDLTIKENDFCYFDPPYANTKGMYFGGFDNNRFFDWLRTLPCHYCLSYDGISGEVNNTYDVPKDLYEKHEYLLSGNSSFKRVIGKSKDSIVYESLYVK